MEKLKTVEIWVKGKVQGVFYRKYTQEKAEAIGLKGFVENLDDGRVHILATGGEGELNQLIEWCETGSPEAVVKDVSSEESNATQKESFYIKR